MTVQEQANIYWHVQRCWHDPSLAIREKMSFKRAVTDLNAVLGSPTKSRVKILARGLLDDIVKNTVSPEVPETVATIK